MPRTRPPLGLRAGAAAAPDAGSGGEGIGRVAASFLLLAAVFFLDRLLGGAAGAIRVHDVFDSEFPRFANEGRLWLAQGGLAWYPHFAGGLPAYAAHHAPCHPLALLVQWVPAWVVYQALALGLMAGAGLGMYLLLARVLGLDPTLARLGGVQFALATQVVNNSIVVSFFTYLFPLFYVLAEDLPELSRGARALALAVLFGFAYPILTVHFAAAHFLILVLLHPLAPGEVRTRLVRAGALWAGFALFCAPNLVTLLRFVPLAHRDYAPDPAGPGEMAAHVLSRLATHGPDRLAESLALPGLFLALLFVLRVPRVRGAALALAACLVPVALVDSKAVGLVAHTFLVRLDLYHLLRVVPSMATVLAMLALAELGELSGRRQVAGLAVLVLAALGAPFAGDAEIQRLPLRMAQTGVALGAGAWLLFRDGAFARPWARRAMLLAAGTGLMLALVGTRLLRLVEEREPFDAVVGPAAGLVDLAPAPGAPPWRAVGWDLQPCLPQLAGLETVDARGPLYFRRYKQLFGLLIEPQLGTPEARAAFAKERFQLHLWSPADRAGTGVDLELLAALNVRYLIGHRPFPRTGALRLVREDPGRPPGDGLLVRLSPGLAEAATRRPVYVYELAGWLPRVQPKARVEVLPGPAEVLAAMGGAGAEALAATAFVEAGELARLGLAAPAPAAEPRPVRLVHYAPDVLELEVGPGPAALVVVAQNHHPGWQAHRGETPVPVLRANHAFLGLALPASGPTRVRLAFVDPWLTTLGLVQLAGLVLILAAGSRPPP